jgi:hypothetical protein
MLRRDLMFTLALVASDASSCNKCTYRECHRSAAAKQLQRNGIKEGVADGNDEDFALRDPSSRSGSCCSRTCPTMAKTFPTYCSWGAQISIACSSTLVGHRALLKLHLIGLLIRIFCALLIAAFMASFTLFTHDPGRVIV